MSRKTLFGALAAALIGGGTATVVAAPISVAPLPGSPYDISDGYATSTTPETSAVSVAPLNGDARLDVVTQRSTFPALHRLFAPADPLASPFTSALLATNTDGELFVDDIDADGDQDLANFRGSLFQGYVNNGAGLFTANTGSALTTASTTVLGRFDAGALPDAVRVASSDKGILFIAGTANGNFTSAPVTIVPADPSGPVVLAAGDLDGDGDADIADGGAGYLRIVRNDGAPAFTSLAKNAVSGTPLALAAADLDEDGKADRIALMSDGHLLVLRSTGGTTDVVTGLPTTATAATIAVAELDGDGHLDVVVGNTTFAANTIRVLAGVGDGTFTAPQSISAPTFSELGQIALGDLSGDGRADFAVSSLDGLRVDLLRNTTPLPGPSATTTGATNLTTTTATVNGTAAANGGANPKVSIEYGTTNALGLSTTQQVLSGGGSQPVNIGLTGLQSATQYFARVKVTTDNGTATGVTINFTTPAPLPEATTTDATNVTLTTATINGTANAKGGANPNVSIEYGPTNAFGSSTTPQALTGNGSQPVSLGLTGLAPGTQYFARVRVTTDSGTATGATINFSTPVSPPEATTTGASAVGPTSATVNGTADAKGGANPKVSIEYGTTSGLGSATTPQILAGSGSVPVNIGVTGLQPATQYFARVKVTTDSGTATGTTITFTTKLAPPTATTTNADPIRPFSATINGTVDAMGANGSVLVEYGRTAALGSVTTSFALNTTGSQAVQVGIPDLQRGTQYFARIRVDTTEGTARGAIISFTTVGAPTARTSGVTDVTATSATVLGSVDDNGGANPMVSANYGTTSPPTMTTTPRALSSTGSQPVGVSLSGLQPLTTYFARIRISTSAGVETGAIISFTTTAPPPAITTLGANNVTPTGANTLAQVDPNGGTNPKVAVEYGTTDALNQTSAQQTLTSDANGQTITVALGGLQPVTKYFYRSRVMTDEGTARGQTLSFTTPDEGAVTLVVPYRGALLSEAPFGMFVDGPAKSVEWDFGDTHASTEADLANPAAGFVPSGVTGGFVAHKYAAVFGSTAGFPSATDVLLTGANETVGVEPGVDGTMPPVAPAGQAERRRTYLVRARVTRPSGRVTVLASTIVVRADTPPRAVPEARHSAPDPDAPLEYTEPVLFSSLSFDPDEFVDSNLDVTGRDQIIRERWDFGDGSAPVVREPPARCAPSPVGQFEGCARSFASTLRHTFFDGLRGSLAPLTDFDPTGSDAQRAAAVRAYVKQLGTAGPDTTSASGPAATRAARKVKLTVTDRSGRTRSRSLTVPLRRRIAPKPELQIIGSTATAEDKSGDGGQKIREPIIADEPGRDGTPVKFDLSKSAVDPRGKIAFHILEVGFPDPKPCPAGARAEDCRRFDEFGLTPPKGGFKPIVVSDEQLAKQGGTVSVTFPEPAGQDRPLSVLDTAYDETGAAGATRYDGFVVEPRGGECKTIKGKTIGKADLVFSGTCVNLNDLNDVFWTQDAITLNGLRVRAAPGEWVVVRRCAKGADSIRSTLDPPSKAGSCPEPPSARHIGKPDPKTPKPLEVLTGGDTITKLDRAAQRDLTDSANFPHLSTIDSTYQGFKLKGDAALGFEKSSGLLGFTVDLPQLLAPAGGQNSGSTIVQTADVPDEVIVRPFNGIGKASRARPVAHAAAVPAPIIDAAATTIGGISIPGLEFEYHPSTDTFVGTAKVDASSFPLPLPAEGAAITVTLRNGEFVEASGDVKATIPLAGAVNLTGFGFTITPKAGGVILQGRVNFGDAASGLILSGSGAVTSELTSNFSVRIDGNAQVVKLLPVTASLNFGGAGVGFGAGTGAQFGPARFNLNLTGAFSGKGFEIAGDGNACLFLCLGVKGLASERAVAGCGSIDLFIATISAGFGVIFDPKDVNIFASCDLSPYGSRIARRAAGTASDFTVPTRPVTEALAITVPAAGLQVGSTEPRPAFGRTPQVQLVAPDRTVVAQTSPELGTTAVTGDSHIFVEQDVEAGVTRFLVPHPATAGSYTVVPLPGSIALADPQYSYGDPPLSKMLNTKVVRNAADEIIAEVKDGDIPVVGGSPHGPGFDETVKKALNFRASPTASASAGAQKKAPYPTSIKPADGLLAPLKVDTSAPQYDPLSGIGNTYVRPAVGKETSTYASKVVDPDLLTATDLRQVLAFTFSGTLPPGQHVSFYEMGPVTTRFLFARKVGSTGTFGGTDAFVPTRSDDRFESIATLAGQPHLPPDRHCIDAFVTNEVGIPRGRVRVTCFDFHPPSIEGPDTEFEVQLPGSAADIKKGATEVIVNPIGIDRLGGQDFAMIDVNKGSFSKSFEISTNYIDKVQAARQVAGRARTSAGPANKRVAKLAHQISLRPVRKRSFAFRVGGLPRGRQPITVKVGGLPVPGQPGKVDYATGTLRPGHKRLMLKLGHG